VHRGIIVLQYVNTSAIAKSFGLVKYVAIFGLLTPAVFCQVDPNFAPVPENPLELASRGVHVVDAPEERDALIRLMEKARAYYTLSGAGRAYQLKTSFTVTSGGQTQFDGDWQMEQIFAPGLGVRLTARTGGDVFEQLKTSSLSYQSTPAGIFPLRLHEAHGHLLGALESAQTMRHDLIRTVAASLDGSPVTCILFSDAARTADSSATGRLWQEREECLDPQTGQLLLHSPAPGLYVRYDFSQPVKFHGKELPAKMTVIENNTTVIEERVESLEALPAVDPNDFTPTAQMRSQTPATVMAGLRTMTLGPTRASSANIQSVVVFGLLTPDGRVTEAHALQSSDAALIDAAIRRVSQMKLQSAAAPGADREQHELFTVVHFAPDGP
jgi:hypothetical protein